MNNKRIELLVLRCLLGLFFIGTFVVALADPKNNLARFQAPVVILGLLAVVQLLDPLSSVGRETNGLKGKLADVQATVQRLKDLAEGHSITTFSNADQYYSELVKALQTTQSSVDLTHIRANVPKDFGKTAHGWFDLVRDWVRAEPSNRSVRRVISIRNPQMATWARSLAVETGGLPFYVSVIDWPLAIPAVNIAILDCHRVFLALPGPTPQRSAGVVTDDAVTVQHFRETYDVLWRSAVELSIWLENDHPG